MKIVVNGEDVDVMESACVADAVALVRPAGSEGGIAVAVNGTVVPRSRWSETRLSETDRIEILTAVAGG